MSRTSKAKRASGPAKTMKRNRSRTRKIEVLLADDHSMFLAGVASIIELERDITIVAQAADGRQAVDLWRKHRPDVTLVDLRMPILDGVGVITTIRQEDASARLVVLTTYDSDNDIYRAIKAGARGYLLKDARREELLDCIRKVHTGETCIPQPVMQKLITGISSEPLTGRETEILQLLAQGSSNKDIAEKLFLSEFTVKGHLRNIFTKLNVLSRTEAVSAATRRGLVHS